MEGYRDTARTGFLPKQELRSGVVSLGAGAEEWGGEFGSRS